MKGGLFDNHSHSYFSADSRMDIVDAVKTAYERGLGGLCLTDHLDFDPPAEWLTSRLTYRPSRRP